MEDNSLLDNTSILTEILLYDDEEYSNYNWKRISKLNGSQTDRLKADIIKHFHTCDVLLRKKKELEQNVKSIDGHSQIKVFFKRTNFRNRKYWFYQKASHYLCKGGLQHNNCTCRTILLWIHLILKVYKRKHEILSMLEDHLERLYDYECQKEDYRDMMLSYHN